MILHRHRNPPARVLHENAWWYYTGRAGMWSPDDATPYDDIAEYECDGQRAWFTRGGVRIADVGWYDEDVYAAQETRGAT